MNDFYKVSILWIIALIFIPIGFQMILSNNPFYIFIAFFITSIILDLMIIFLIKAIIME